MPTSVYITHSHSWLRARLLEQAAVPPEVELVTRPQDAELIVYLEPPWPDEEAPDTLKRLMPRYLERICVYSQSDMPIPWAPGMYASLSERRRFLSRGYAGAFYVVQHLRESGGLAEHLEESRSLSPELLWSFVGTPGNAPLRGRLFALDDPRSLVADTTHFSDTLRWAWKTTYREEAQEAFRMYAMSLGRSKFVLCPRGVGLSSIRIFEALQAGRCPVIVSDGWLPPPFVDWDSCSIRLPEDQVIRIPEILRQREEEAERMGDAARAVWERFFSPERQLSTLILGCIEIQKRVGRGDRAAMLAAALSSRRSLRRLASAGRRSARRLGARIAS